MSAEHDDGADDSDAPEFVQGKYVTEAVESSVLVDDETIGHVALFDLDDATLDEAREVAELLGGFVAILESSPGSWHVWALSIRPLNLLLEVAQTFDAVDVEHTALNSRRGCCVLRVDAKVSAETGDEVKPAPEFAEAIATPSDQLHSAPHFRVLEALIGDDVERPDRYEWVGERLDRRVYMADVGGR